MYTIQRLVGKQITGFFQHKVLQKLTRACLDAHMERTSANRFLRCHGSVVSGGEARGGGSGAAARA